MPVKTEPSMSLIDYLSNEMLSWCGNDFMLPDDIWKKFELDFPELVGFEEILRDSALQENCANFFKGIHQQRVCEIRNHDCMWAGHCASKEHPADEPRPCMVPVPPAPIVAAAPAAEVKQECVAAGATATGQQSLLKPAFRSAPAAQPAPPTPHTPPMSDDEEAKTKTVNLMKIFQSSIEEYDIEEDSDLYEYFEEKDIKEFEMAEASEPVVEEEKPNVNKVYQFAAESDHSYHKGTNAQMPIFGIETPSDSEEEIDVVNVNEKYHFCNKNVFSFPNNPSNRDRQQIQRRMATAISRKKMVPRMKPAAAARKIVQEPTTAAAAAKKSPTESRGLKRRQYKASLQAPYKRRHYGNSSDSEPEPSEKRSLHNNMERQRRIDLRNAFEDLRVLVPEVSKKDRAAKVVILREASQYCEYLTQTSVNYTAHLKELKKQQEFLRRRVSQLRRNLAANR
ncbi:unnamed protein product [Phyllotreta striolata]|uniref:BHLH domain-containing protein n=1 Tax=Phyllotreta striolata TaxID=444603 RepID=A0A9N9XQB3_PHYSR|nr:unnamed protein product [Phyllotreta striolata]